MATDDTLKREIVDLQKRLVELDRERASILIAIEQLQKRRAADVQPTVPLATDVATATPMSNTEKNHLISFAVPWSR